MRRHPMGTERQDEDDTREGGSQQKPGQGGQGQKPQPGQGGQQKPGGGQR